MRQGLYTVLITTSSYHFSQKKEGVSNTVVSKLLGEKCSLYNLCKIIQTTQ